MAQRYPVLSDEEAKRELGKWVSGYSSGESDRQERRTTHEFTENVDGDFRGNALSVPYG